MTDSELDELIAWWLEGQISESDSQRLQATLQDSKAARDRFRKLCSLDAGLRMIAAGEHPVSASKLTVSSAESAVVSPVTDLAPVERGSRALRWGVAACVSVLIAAAAYQYGKFSQPGRQRLPNSQVAGQPNGKAALPEKRVAGYATLRRAVDVQWSDDVSSYRDGDVLPAGMFALDRGLVEIDFFCGATVVVQGPARLELQSDWALRLHQGYLRANVPPAAQGFVVKTADSEIVDLGTEFGLEVDADRVYVHVVDGEVKLRGGKYDGQHLTTGQERLLQGRASQDRPPANQIGDVDQLYRSEQQLRFERWQATKQDLRQDDRLIAFYAMDEPAGAARRVVNLSQAGAPLNGKLVGGTMRAEGRFEARSSGLDFGQLGARVRAKLPGEFQAFTFVCWAKIDRLQHRFNALFMSDGYEDGEPHWQIRHDGKLMLSVMVEAAPNSRKNVDRDGNCHRVYYTPPIWDDSLRGRWFHIASVYDSQAQAVRQYVNGQEVSHETILPQYRVDSLRIGAAEIGNWGQPFRETPDFAVRNLNGTIDEMMIFNAALSAQEIQGLFENGKPIGY